jgi:hypothetical protein
LRTFVRRLGIEIAAGNRMGRGVARPAGATTADDGRLEWDGVDLFPVTSEGPIASKDVYSTWGTPRVLCS